MHEEKYYWEFLKAYIVGKFPESQSFLDEEIASKGYDEDIKLYHFKRKEILPRVHRVIGMLKSMFPATLLDVGSGRGTFLWPLLEALPDLEVTSIDLNENAIRICQDVHAGGMGRLRGRLMDARSLDFDSGSFDGVTLLEVLEHMENPEDAVAEACRVSRSFVIVSVPSKPDDNPEHIHLFDQEMIRSMFDRCVVRNVRFEHVREHMIAVVTK